MKFTVIIILYLKSWKIALVIPQNNITTTSSTTTTRKQQKIKIKQTQEKTAKTFYTVQQVLENMTYISAKTSVIVQGFDFQALTSKNGSIGIIVRKKTLPMPHNAISP